MNTTRTIALSLVFAVCAFAPAMAIAKDGADDNPSVGEDNGGLRDAGTSGSDDSSSSGDSTRAKRATGTCTGRATAKIKAKNDDGRIETEFEVDQNRNGVTWKVTIRRNGTRVVSTKATTKAPSGSFSVERRIANPAGTDRITARAVSPSGQVCTARVTI
jgi:hypothetical protein